MHLYQAVAVADQNGKTYISPYGTYSKEDGFDLRPVNIQHYYDFEEVLYKLVHEDCWKLKVDKKKMTKADIEKELGYEIDIVGENTTYKNFEDFMKELFGEK